MNNITYPGNRGRSWSDLINQKNDERIANFAQANLTVSDIY